eukprot:TRINITY_DN111087_c0_g1_i1.p1 TRINITY_DN111087_c0_g1~~TRINITY_DN111087_c0_g1_i1.p1  ORF type:complete len:759 (-),score=227.26 TRINITY_DN111087_c0_g1_i1:34-2310(-)
MPKRKRPPASDATPWAGPKSVVSMAEFLKGAGLSAGALSASRSASFGLPPTVAAELQRCKALDGLRQRLLSDCGAQNGQVRYPSMAFERWWFSARYGSKMAARQEEPLLPASADPRDSALLGDLTQVGFDAAAAAKVTSRLAQSSAAAAANLKKATPARVGAVQLVRSSDSDTVELRCPATQACAVLTSAAITKLQALYKVHSKSVPKAPAFEEAALVLALRYQALGGGGFHLALPPSAFEVLTAEFGVSAECFASPFNCWHSRYCSAFPDCDAVFGSLGSFFDFRPKAGSFEANPPFAPAVLARMREHIEDLLAEASDPLSFVVTIANWEHAEVEALRKSAFVKATLSVAGDEQKWSDGSKARRAPVDLLILIMQNKAATQHAKFKVSEEKLEALRQSCTGDAAPLGPRKKKARLESEKDETATNGGTREAASLKEGDDEEGEEKEDEEEEEEEGEESEEEDGDDEEACEDEDGKAKEDEKPPRLRPPMWRLWKMKKIAALGKLRKANAAFKWSSEVTSGWYERNMQFWGNEADNVDGMTGGGVSKADLEFSKPIMAQLASRCGSAADGRFARALDVGAGIGRVAKAILQPHCDRIDLVEPIPKHLEAAKRDLKEGSWPGEFILGALQDFVAPKDAKYDLVWCQWLLMYIVDADVIAFLKRVADQLLAPAGILVVKENIGYKRVGPYFDDETGELWQPGTKAVKSGKSKPLSVVRTEAHHMKMFEQAGLRLLMKTKQKFVTEDMPMAMYVLYKPGLS